jgi:hypothetical protein
MAAKLSPTGMTLRIVLLEQAITEMVPSIVSPQYSLSLPEL